MSKKLKRMRHISGKEILAASIMEKAKELTGDYPTIKGWEIEDAYEYRTEDSLHALVILMRRGFYVLRKGFTSVHINAPYVGEYHKIVVYAEDYSALNSLLLLTKKHGKADTAIAYYLSYNSDSFEGMREVYDRCFPHIHRDPDNFFADQTVRKIWKEVHNDKDREKRK